MTFDLKSIQKTRRDVPPRVVVYGPHKIGKSTFASCAPAPVFVQTEDGLDSIDASAFPLAQSWQDIMAAVGTLYTEPHDFRTVVLDSADWAEKLCWGAVAEEHGKSGIEEIGYGKGYVYAAEKFNDLFAGLNALRLDRNMNIIVLCHTEVKHYDDPLADSYDRHQIKMHKHSAKILQEWADVIGFAQLESQTRTKKGKGFRDDRTVAMTTGRRVLHLANNPAHDAGNRYGLPDQIDLTWPAFEQALNAARGNDGE